MIYTTLLVFAVACLLGGILTAIVCRIAPRVGLTDHPDGHRKSHKHPTPLGGGLAVFTATTCLLGILFLVPSTLRPTLRAHWTDIAWLLAAGATIVLIGLIDDRFGLRGRQKLLGQILAASILMVGGLLIQNVNILGWHLSLGLLGVPFTLFWLLGAINSINLLDGIDGLASTIGLILVLTIAVMAANAHSHVAVIALVFAGTLLGFLCFNFPPAKMFLGDAGSMLIGLVVGALAIQGSLKSAGTVLLAAPLAVLAIPIFDSTAAILRRKLTGRSIYTTDRGHLHHQLLDIFGSDRKVLACVAISCAATSAAALAGIFMKNDWLALVTCAAVMSVFVATGLFGRAECLLAAKRCWRIGHSLVPRAASKNPTAIQTTVRLQGSKDWDLLWETLTEAAEKLSLTKVHLSVHLPAAGDGYHATWEQRARHHVEDCWQLVLPLRTSDRRVGRLTIFGEQNGHAVYQDLDILFEFLEAFDTQFQRVAWPEAPLPLSLALQKEQPAETAEIISDIPT